MAYVPRLDICTSRTANEWLAAHPEAKELISWTPGKLIPILPVRTRAPEHTPTTLDAMLHTAKEAQEGSSDLGVRPPVPMDFLRLQMALRRPHLLTTLSALEFMSERPDLLMDDAAAHVGRHQTCISNQTKLLRAFVSVIVDVWKHPPRNEWEEMVLAGMSQTDIGIRKGLTQSTVSRLVRAQCRPPYSALGRLGTSPVALSQARADANPVWDPQSAYGRLLRGVAWEAVDILIDARTAHPAGCHAFIDNLRGTKDMRKAMALTPDAQDIIEEIRQAIPSMAHVLTV